MSRRHWEEAISIASDGGRLWFTRNQLYAAYSESIDWRKSRWTWAALTLGLVGGMVLRLGLRTSLFSGVMLAMIVAMAIESRLGWHRARFEWALARRLRRGGIDRLISGPKLMRLPDEGGEPLVLDYEVAAILIVEREDIVDVLTLNGFAAAEKLLVVTERGYPESALPLLTWLLKQQPGFTVLLLHDATKAGRGMQERVVSSGQFEGARLVDLGAAATVDAVLYRELTNRLSSPAGSAVSAGQARNGSDS